MLFDWNAVAAPGQVQDVQPCAPLTLTGDGLWVCLVSSGRCTASVPSAGPLPAGAALLLPPQSVPAGHLVLSRAPLVLEPEGSCHLLCVQLTGQASAQFLAGLHELPFLARGETCPAAAELLDRLASEQDLPGRVRSQLAFALLCELADADSAAPALPPLVQAAIADIRANYAGLYGVEELSERLGVSKSHLVRTFTAALGIPPGRYLTRVRVEAAQRLLLHRSHCAVRAFARRSSARAGTLYLRSCRCLFLVLHPVHRGVCTFYRAAEFFLAGVEHRIARRDIRQPGQLGTVVLQPAGKGRVQLIDPVHIPPRTFRLRPQIRPIQGATLSSTSLTSLCSQINCTGALSSMLPVHSHRDDRMIVTNNRRVTLLWLSSMAGLMPTATSMMTMANTVNQMLAV